MFVLLTGAKGFIGSQLLARLCASGHKVRVVTRTSFESSFSGVEVVLADLTNPDTNYDSLVSGCEVVFNCAGEIRDKKAMRLLHVDATGRLIAAVNRQASPEHPIHFVQLSSVGAYGPAQGALRTVSETTEENPQGTYEETKTVADSLVMRSGGSEFFSYSILRPSNVFGANMTNNSLRQLGRVVQKGLFFYIGTARRDAVATYIHVEDVASALMLCGFHPSARGEIFNLSNDCPLSDLINGMADAQHVSRPKWSVSETLLRVMVTVANRFLRLPVTPARIDALVSKTTYPATKIRDTLGFVPEKNVPEAISELFTKRPIA